MRKKKEAKAQRAKFAFEDALYRWEFLKRSEKYRGDYDSFVKKYGDEGVRVRFTPEWIVAECEKRGESARVPVKGCFIDRLQNDIFKFRRSWGIDPTDPKSTYPPFLDERVSWVSEVVNGDSVTAKHADELILNINLSGPESEVLAYLNWRIRREKEARGLLSPEKNDKKHFNSFTSYLLAFDLKETGKTDQEIARDARMLELAALTNVQMNSKRVFTYRNRARLLILKAQRGDW